jgi:hypothetical protein
MYDQQAKERQKDHGGTAPGKGKKSLQAICQPHRAGGLRQRVEMRPNKSLHADGGRMTVLQSSTSHQPPRQVNDTIREEGRTGWL